MILKLLETHIFYLDETRCWHRD